MVLVHDTSSRRGLQVYQVSLKNLERFSSYRADTICDGQTDGRTDGQTDGQTDARGKTICLPTLSGGDITTCTRSVKCSVKNLNCTQTIKKTSTIQYNLHDLSIVLAEPVSVLLGSLCLPPWSGGSSPV